MIVEPANDTLNLAARLLVSLLQRHVPELVAGLHLIGSAADGDFRPGHSDLDFIAVLTHPATDDEIEALVIVHRIYAADPTLPTLDGIWVTPSELTAGPDASGDGPTSHSGQFLGLARGDRNPITWEMLRQGAATTYGELDRSALWHDPARLAAWTRENVDAYWVPWHARASILLSAPGVAMLGGATLMWSVLGVSRAHYTLATGKVASKSAAGNHALAVFGQRWHSIVRECLRIRRGERGSLYRNPLERRRDALAFIGMVIEAIGDGYRASE